MRRPSFKPFPQNSPKTPNRIAGGRCLSLRLGGRRFEPGLQSVALVLMRWPVLGLTSLIRQLDQAKGEGECERTGLQYITVLHAVQRFNWALPPCPKQLEQYRSRWGRDSAATWGFTEKRASPVFERIQCNRENG